MVKPLKLTKTVTTGVLIASCITSTLPTHAFATQASAYADEFQAFVEGVESNKTDDAIADQAEQGTDQAAPVQPATPVEPAAPASPEQTAPQGEPVAPAEDAQTSASSSAGVTEADGKSDVVKKDEAVADKAVGNEKEVAPEASDKAKVAEPAAEITAEVAPASVAAEAGAQEQTLGTLEQLFPNPTLRNKVKMGGVQEGKPLKASDFEPVTDIVLYLDETQGLKLSEQDCRSLGYLKNVKNFFFQGKENAMPKIGPLITWMFFGIPLVR